MLPTSNMEKNTGANAYEPTPPRSSHCSPAAFTEILAAYPSTDDATMFPIYAQQKRKHVHVQRPSLSPSPPATSRIRGRVLARRTNEPIFASLCSEAHMMLTSNLNDQGAWQPPQHRRQQHLHPPLKKKHDSTAARQTRCQPKSIRPPSLTASRCSHACLSLVDPSGITHSRKIVHYARKGGAPSPFRAPHVGGVLLQQFSHSPFFPGRYRPPFRRQPANPNKKRRTFYEADQEEAEARPPPAPPGFARFSQSSVRALFRWVSSTKRLSQPPVAPFIIRRPPCP